jgi:peptidoglycan/xylan/chitin deacetylase (PgdA/CDA1 family)
MVSRGPGVSGGGGTTSVSTRPTVRGNLTAVSTFQTGHGWTVTGTGSTSNVNDTTDFVLGSQSLRGVTAGTAVATSIRRTGLPNVDLTDKAIRVLVKITNLANMASMQCYAGSAAFANFYVIPVYNPGDGKTIREGEWTWLEFNFNASGLATTGGGTPAKNTITDWQIRWTDDATAPVTVQVNAVGVVPQPAVFPNGVVSIACDDSYDSQANVLATTMDKYGFAGTAYLICDQIGQPGGMTLAQLQTMQDLKGWEIAAHAYAASVHNATFTGVSLGTLEADLRSMKSYLSVNGFGRYDTLAYPLGQANPAVERLVGEYFSLARTVTSTPENTLAPADVMKMRSKSVSNVTTPAQLQTIVDNAYANRNWVIVTFHKLVTTPTVSTEFATASLVTFVDYLATKGIPVRPVGEVATLIRA